MACSIEKGEEPRSVDKIPVLPLVTDTSPRLPPSAAFSDTGRETPRHASDDGPELLGRVVPAVTCWRI